MADYRNEYSQQLLYKAVNGSRVYDDDTPTRAHAFNISSLRGGDPHIADARKP